MIQYEAIIGLEVHVHLATKTKLFCGCRSSAFGAQANIHTCPVCTGQPGVLPVINRQAVEHAMMAGLALNCQIAEFTKFDRKNYHYPDLPKGYQISQYDLPISSGGWMEIEADGQRKRIRVRRAHLEEDAGKLIHQGDSSLVDLNRAGVPTLEIVTEPDLRSANETYAFLTKLQTILRYLNVSTADMEKGDMRCEPNVSIRPAGATEFGTLTEIKNLNSFRSVRAAIAYEIERQTAVLESGGRVARVTMGWDEQKHVTVPQRSKEGAEDYRYFPEPDLPPLLIDRQWVESLREKMPELPDAKQKRFVADYELSDYDAGVLAAERAVAEYFEKAVRAYAGGAGESDSNRAKTISNWVSGELFRLMNESGTTVESIRVTPGNLAELASLVDKKTINHQTARDVLGKMFQSGKTASEIVQAKGLAQISDQDALEAVVERVLEEHPEQVAAYLAGKDSLLQWLMGQVMRATRGKANPQVVLSLLSERLGAGR
ncbi:MAG: Asp-tRNA(Asn)/Glu-tRNA(Gln) amidotransferase subunit GatB [Anaerolineales bacterium]|nr:Asp-tRNA(Asn)/Glu-tRNA(Gln) amidotransferase subunit GatB [Anaerolineales bacterium]